MAAVGGRGARPDLLVRTKRAPRVGVGAKSRTALSTRRAADNESNLTRSSSQIVSTDIVHPHVVLVHPALECSLRLYERLGEFCRVKSYTAP